MKRLLAICAKYPRALLVVGLCLLLALLSAEGLVATVQPIRGAAPQDSSPASGLAFSAKAYAARIWSRRVVPAARDDSTPLTHLLAAIATNKGVALRKFGHEAGGAYNMLVRFSGQVSQVNASSPIGTITVDVVGKKGGLIPVKVAIGPVILGTTLRDALRFIRFGEFLNQIQYGNVADALNGQVNKKVIAPLRLTQLKGRKVTVFGAYTYDRSNPRGITITPVILRVDQGRAN